MADSVLDGLGAKVSVALTDIMPIATGAADLQKVDLQTLFGENLVGVRGLPAGAGFIYKDTGSPNWTLTADNQARTALGLGTGDSPTFTGLTLTGVLGASNGTGALPSVSFASDLDLGLFRIAANSLGAVANTAIVATSAGFATGLAASVDLSSSAARFSVFDFAGVDCVHMHEYRNSTAGIVFAAAKSRSTVVGTFVAVASGDFMLHQTSYGDDGAAFRASARYTHTVDGAVSSGIVPGRHDFLVARASDGALTQAARINALSCTILGTATTHDGTSTLQVNGGSNITGTATFGGDLTFGSGVDINTNTTTGTMFGTTSSQKIGFWGATPIVRGTAFTQTYSTASHTCSARVAQAITDNSTGTSGYPTIAAVTNPTLAWNGVLAPTAAEATAINAAITALKNAVATLAAGANNNRTDSLVNANVLNGLIDDVQAVGLSA